MSDNNNPSIDPADNDTLVGAVTFAIRKKVQDLHGMLPAHVLEYDRTTNRARVQLLIDMVGTDGKRYPRPQLNSVPVCLVGGGGFSLSFPLKRGDKGWVQANDRDISLYLQSGQQSAPNTGRVKSFSDGVFFPDAMTAQVDNIEAVVLQNKDASISISISAQGVLIKADKVYIDTGSPTGVIAVNGILNVSGTVSPNIPYVPPVP